jgi:hypothetical protein
MTQETEKKKFEIYEIIDPEVLYERWKNQDWASDQFESGFIFFQPDPDDPDVSYYSNILNRCPEATVYYKLVRGFITEIIVPLCFNNPTEDPDDHE